MSTVIRGYFACLASYNDGWLHGVWLDLNVEREDLDYEISLMLKRSPVPGAEEWAMHDHEHLPSGLYSEHPDLDKITEYARLADSQPDDDHRAALAAWVDNHHGQVDLDDFTEKYRGRWDSTTDFASDQTDELGLAGIIPPGRNLAVVYVNKSGHGHTDYGQGGTNLLDDLSRFLNWDAITEHVMQDYDAVDAPGGGTFIYSNH